MLSVLSLVQHLHWRADASDVRSVWVVARKTSSDSVGLSHKHGKHTRLVLSNIILLFLTWNWVAWWQFQTGFFQKFVLKITIVKSKSVMTWVIRTAVLELATKIIDCHCTYIFKNISSQRFSSIVSRLNRYCK